MGSEASKGAGKDEQLDGNTAEFDVQIAAEAAAEQAAEDHAANGRVDPYASGNLMPATPGRGGALDTGLIAVGGPGAFGPATTPPGTAERMYAEVSGDPPPWSNTGDVGPRIDEDAILRMEQKMDPMCSFGTEVEPNKGAALVAAADQAAVAAAKPVEATAPRPVTSSPVSEDSVGAALAAERARANAEIDAGIRADEEAMMNDIMGEYGTGASFGGTATNFNATGSTAASSDAEDLMSLTDLRKEVGVGVGLMSTGELVESLMDETTHEGADTLPTPRFN